MNESKTPRTDAEAINGAHDPRFVPTDFARQIETELAAAKAREAELAAALEFINDECDWEPGGDYWNWAGDKRIGPACDKALEAWRAAK